MRTLKKSLALVLALVMVLGLGVVGASADNALDNYTDTGDIGDAYLEAVGVLTGLGIVDGMTDTTIEPDGTYTRAQAAKIVATMLLGVDAADSLKATTAPFEDVPTYHWASGYIAYCVEAGIIDGMTATTFEPEGTLTGFQWAKMLLSAVGFGVNGEFEGDSWSLNTATVGHQSGLFTGDLDGADHVALRREQAMLYAFNALTKLPQVTYSKENTNYLYGILGYFFADGTGHTLGDDTFDLTFVEGQIIDNEGMGNANTIVDNVAYTGRRGSPAEYITVDAGTGLDLMYHAVRLWYVDGKTNTGVYTYDLAKTTVYECMNIAAGDKEAAKLKSVETPSIGYAVGKAEYETYLIDNTALDLANDYAYVSLWADVGSLTYRNTAKDTTTIAGQVADNDDILTDISDIKYGDTVVYYHVYSTSSTDDGEAWYVYPVTTTSGVVSKISQQNGSVVSVTLADNTVLEMSTLFGKLGNDTEKFVIGNNYSFVLDTHGDVIGIYRDGARDLWAFTGDYKLSNEFGDYFSDYVVEAQFVNVSTGKVADYPVTFRNTDYNKIFALRNMYFDISATDVNGLYVATQIVPRDNVYADTYIIDDTATFNGSNDTLSVYMNGHAVNVYYDPDTVHFIIASGTGSSLKVTEFDGVDELLAGFNAAKNVTLENYAAVVTSNETSNVATTIFAFTDRLVGVGDYVFVPYDVTRDKWTSVSGDPLGYVVSYDGVAYQNGEAITVDYVTTDALNNTVLERGFYTYYIDANGKVTLDSKMENVTNGDCFYGEPSLVHAATYWTLGGHRVNSEAPVVDLREGSDYAEITTVEELWQGCYNPYTNKCDPAVTVAYTLDSNGRVDCIYVVRDGWASKVTVKMTDKLDAAGWEVVGTPKLDTTNKEIVVYLANDNVNLVDGTQYTVSAVANNATMDGKAVVVNGQVKVTITTNDWSVIERDVTITLDIADRKGITFIGNSNYNVSGTMPAGYEVGQPFTVTITKTDGSNFSAGRYEVRFANGNEVLVDEVGISTDATSLTCIFYPTRNLKYNITYLEVVNA